MKKTKLLSLITASGLFFTTPTFAEFNVQNANSDSNPALNENKHYGNAHTVDFDKAIEGTDMGAKEQAEVAYILPAAYENSFYGRFSMHFGRNRLSKIKNNSNGTNAGATVAQQSKNASGKGIEVAFGKVMSGWRAEVEWLLVDDIV